MLKSKHTTLPIIQISPQKKQELHGRLKELYYDMKSRFKNFHVKFRLKE